KLLQQLAARRRALDEDRIVECHLRDRLDRAERRVAGEEHKGAPRGSPEDLNYFMSGRGDELLGSRVRHTPREIQDCLRSKIELRWQPDLVGLFDPKSAADVLERA